MVLHYGVNLQIASSNSKKKAIRAITGSGSNAHTSPHLKNLKLLSIGDIYVTKLLCLYKQLKDQKLPGPIANLFELNELNIFMILAPNAPRIKIYEN